MAWERLALVCVILLPPLCLLVLVAPMAALADHTFITRLLFFPVNIRIPWWLVSADRGCRA